MLTSKDIAFDKSVEEAFEMKDTTYFEKIIKDCDNEYDDIIEDLTGNMNILQRQEQIQTLAQLNYKVIRLTLLKDKVMIQKILNGEVSTL